ncbi:DUF6883 domain-containing protein [Acidithiobacillus ferriphilus]
MTDRHEAKTHGSPHQGKSAVVRTGWIIRTGEDVPRLTSCYVRTS